MHAFLAGGQVLSRPSSRTCQCDSESPTPTSFLVVNCWVTVVCWCGYPYANISSSIGEDQCINSVESTRSTAAECLVVFCMFWHCRICKVKWTNEGQSLSVILGQKRLFCCMMSLNETISGLQYLILMVMFWPLKLFFWFLWHALFTFYYTEYWLGGR